MWESTRHDGVYFESRFGNRLKLFATFERAATSSVVGGRSTLLTGEVKSQQVVYEFVRLVVRRANLVVVNSMPR